MKTVDITKLPEGTKFLYDGEEFQVTDRNEYPFILAKCLTEPNEYEGLGLMFANFEQVDVDDNVQLEVIKPIVYTP